MDERLSAACRGMLGLLAGLAACALAQPAAAQALVDPTRPPGMLDAPAAAQAAAPAVRRLQSVLISPARKVAVIDGVAVALGGKVGGATLVRIAAHEVELREGNETEVLALLPGIEKKPVERTGAGGGRK